MKDLPEIKDATPEQQKEISKILFRTQVSLLGITAKFGVGLFLANMVSILFGKYFLQDTDPEMQVGFQMVSLIINAIFMIRYLNRQTVKTNDILVEKIKEVLKK